MEEYLMKEESEGFSKVLGEWSLLLGDLLFLIE